MEFIRVQFCKNNLNFFRFSEKFGFGMAFINLYIQVNIFVNINLSTNKTRAWDLKYMCGSFVRGIINISTSDCFFERTQILRFVDNELNKPRCNELQNTEGNI